MRRAGSSSRLLLLRSSLALASTLVLGGCRYRPAHFADRPEVVKVGDDIAIPVPDRNDFDEVLQVSDVYLRRPLFDALSPVVAGYLASGVFSSTSG